MAEANYSIEPVIEVPLDLDLLAQQSDFYRALVDFHGTDAINVLAYPIGSPFTKHCFTAVLKNLGSKEEFSETLNNFPIGDLFKVALYLGSDTLLYHLVIDKLQATTAITLLDLAIDIMGMDHYITNTIIQFTSIITHFTRSEVIRYMATSKTKIREKIRNNRKKSGKLVPGCKVLRWFKTPEHFMESFKHPNVCLICQLPLSDMHATDIATRVVPMGCCGMMFHLTCQLEFLKRKNLPNCPACGTTYQHGIINKEYTSLGSILAIHRLQDSHILPIAYRFRNIDWKSLLPKDYYEIHGPSYNGNGYPG